MAKLSEYSAKRRFEATPEPAPVVPVHGAGPLLFVVQQHAARQLHYDFRLECDGVLKSWAVPKGPSLDPNDKRLAVFVEDHPYDYGSFEGVIPPKQYGAGEVIVWDCGVYSPDEGGIWFHDRAEAERRVREGIAAGKLSIQLRGEKLKGSFALVRTKDAKTWLLIKHKDRFVTTADVTTQDRSVLSGVAVKDLKVVPAHRIPASQLAPDGHGQRRCRRSSSRCWPNRRRAVQPSGLVVGAQARRLSRDGVHRRARHPPAFAAWARTGRAPFPRLPRNCASRRRTA